MRLTLRPLAQALGVCLSVMLCPLAAAQDGAQAPKTSPGKPAQMAEKKPGAPLRVGAEAEDPMEALRKRLADRLGNKVTSDADDPDTMRLNVRGEGPPEPATGSQGSRRKGKPAAPKAPPAWSYQGATGPAHWGTLGPQYKLCASGQRQSPIDIRDGIAVNLDPILFDYQNSPFSVTDNGKTVAVTPGTGNWIEVMGRRFQLQRVEFRMPAEERIDGRKFDLGAHLIHRDEEGRLAVIAVVLDRGADQPVIQTIWNNLPLEKGDVLQARAGVNWQDLLPSDRRYFTYMGSMTTPPCQEGVLWLVMKSPVAVSSEQLEVFARLHPMNARPVQPAAGRLIKGPM